MCLDKLISNTHHIFSCQYNEVLFFNPLIKKLCYTKEVMKVQVLDSPTDVTFFVFYISALGTVSNVFYFIPFKFTHKVFFLHFFCILDIISKLYLKVKRNFSLVVRLFGCTHENHLIPIIRKLFRMRQMCTGRSVGHLPYAKPYCVQVSLLLNFH